MEIALDTLVVFGVVTVLVVSGVVTILARYHYLRKKEQERRLSPQVSYPPLSQALGYPGAAGGQGALQQVIAYQQGLPLKRRSTDLELILDKGATFVGDEDRQADKDQQPGDDPWGNAVGQSTVQRR